MSIVAKRILPAVGTILLGLSLGSCDSSESAESPSPAAVQAAAKGTEENGSGNGLYELGRQPLDVTFYAHYSYYSMPEWGADPSSRWIRDNKKVNVRAIGADANSPQKLQTMIASNTLPDLIWGERDSDFERLREAGLLVPLDAYIEKYPNLKEWAGERILNMLRAPDGHIYYFPNYYTNKPYGNAGYVVNKKIYRTLGSPKLETTDDLYAYLKLVKARYPDVVPFETGMARVGNGIDQLFSAFKEDNFSFTRYYAVTSGDRMTSIYNDEGFRESVQYVARLMREGLMTQDALTQTEGQVAEKLMNGRVAVFASADPMKMTMEADAALSRGDPEGGYFFIEPICKEGLDKSRIYPGTYNLLGWNAAAITKNADDPEAIFAMLDWMTGPEGSAVQMWGPPGPDGYWDGFKEDGVTPAFTDKYVKDPDGLTRIQALSGDMIWVGNTTYLDQTKSAYEATLPEEDRSWSAYWQHKITWKSQGDATPFVNLYPEPDSEEGIIHRQLKEIWLKTRAETMYAESDQEVLDRLDAANRESFEVGYQKYLNYITDKWRANLRTLGKA